MTASVIAKNTAQRAPGILEVNAVCIDVLILSWLCDPFFLFVCFCFLFLFLFCIALLLPSGFGGSQNGVDFKSAVRGKCTGTDLMQQFLSL